MKQLLYGFLGAALACSCAAPTLAQNGISIIVNGQQMNFVQPPIEQAGRVYVPLRGIFEQLGASVVYQNGTINATGNGRNVSLHIGSNQAEVNGQEVVLSSPPFIQGETTLVPLRFVAQSLGANVDWNNNTSTVTISGNGYHGGYHQPGYNQPGYNGPPQQPMNANAYILDREPLGVASEAEPGISGRFAMPVQRDSIHVTLDGHDITGAVLLNDRGFQWTPGHALYPGRHRVEVSGTTRDGAQFTTGWDFRVNP
jgi:hypothetical protein